MDKDFHFSVVDPKDQHQGMEDIRALLAANELELDVHNEVWVVCHAPGRLVACAGLDHNVIKCVAVAREFRGESLSLRLGSETVALAAQRGYFHLFVYSPPHNRELFRGWGFYPVVEVPGLVLLMENSPIAITRYCESLRLQRRPGSQTGCIVLNANPFTLGHRFLIETAASECDWLHVFIVGEDASAFSYTDRFSLVAEGVKSIGRLTLHEGSDYIISRATFPGYFLKEKETIDRSWAGIDLLLFRECIGPGLGITHRYVGTEPLDPVTNKYNAEMKYWLQDAPSRASTITVVEVPRISVNGAPISASRVRRLLSPSDFEAIKHLVPETTLHFLERSCSSAGAVEA